MSIAKDYVNHRSWSSSHMKSLLSIHNIISVLTKHRRNVQLQRNKSVWIRLFAYVLNFIKAKQIGISINVSNWKNSSRFNPMSSISVDFIDCRDILKKIAENLQDRANLYRNWTTVTLTIFSIINQKNTENVMLRSILFGIPSKGWGNMATKILCSSNSVVNFSRSHNRLKRYCAHSVRPVNTSRARIQFSCLIFFVN